MQWLDAIDSEGLGAETGEVTEKGIQSQLKLDGKWLLLV